MNNTIKIEIDDTDIDNLLKKVETIKNNLLQIVELINSINITKNYTTVGDILNEISDDKKNHNSWL